MVHDIIRLGEYHKWHVESFGVSSDEVFNTHEEALVHLESLGYRKIDLEQDNGTGSEPREIWVLDIEPEIEDYSTDENYLHVRGKLPPED